MSKEEAKKEGEATEAAPKKSKKKLIIIIAVVLVLIIVGALGAVFMMKKKHKAAEEGGEEEPVAEAPAAPKVDPHKPPVFMPLEPFTVNLQAENGEEFLQIIATLRIKDHSVEEQLKVLMPEVRHRLLMLLSSKYPSEISTPEGREELAEDMKLEINTALGYAPPKKKPHKKKEKEKANSGHDEEGEPITAVFFTQFMIQ